MSKSYVTSDQHFYGHKVLTYRPFKDMNEMNDTMLECINNTVEENDILYWSGDISNGDIEQTLNILNNIRCKNKILIPGNWDNIILENKCLSEKFILIDKIHEVWYKNYLFVICHYPIAIHHHWDSGEHLNNPNPENPIYSICLSGHVHSRLKPKGNYHLYKDCGVDAVGFNPLSLDQIIEEMQPRIKVYKKTAITEDLF